MSSIPEYERGHRDGIKAAVTWLHKRANEMNDPHAKQLLDGAAFNLGSDFSLKSGRTVPNALAASPSGREI